jgi:hypothetical protein
MNTRIGGGVVAFVVVVLVLGFVIGSTWSSSDSSHVTVVWNGGPLDSKAFASYQPPGSGRKFVGLLQTKVEFPTGLRQYRVSDDPGSQNDYQGQIVVSVRGMRMSFEPTVLFTLNTDIREGKPLVADFYEKHLRQFGATDFDSVGQGAKWVGFLNTRVYPVVRDVMARVLAPLDPVAVRYNTDGTRDKAAADIETALSDAIGTNLGNRYLCGPNYGFGQPAEQCGNVQLQLPEPGVSDEDANILAAPQRARTDADAAIAAAKEDTRKAGTLATEKEAQVDAARRAGVADLAIAQAQNTAKDAQAVGDTAKCRALTSLGQDCALVLAAENKDFPDVVAGAGSTIVAAGQGSQQP